MKISQGWGAGRNTADEYENELGISRPRVGRALGGWHSLLGVARELAARRPGWRTPGFPAGHRSARAPGFSISLDGATESAISCTGGTLQPSGDRSVQPTRGIACPIAGPTSIRKRGVTGAVSSNTRGPDGNAAC
jgi:hypothetical protein